MGFRRQAGGGWVAGGHRIVELACPGVRRLEGRRNGMAGNDWGSESGAAGHST
jgi:hypothetical protein